MEHGDIPAATDAGYLGVLPQEEAPLRTCEAELVSAFHYSSIEINGGNEGAEDLFASVKQSRPSLTPFSTRCD